MSPPIPLGTQSLSEYCTVDTDMPADEFKTLYNKYCIKGINCLNAVNVVKNPNIAANAAAALYEIKSKFLKENFENIIEKKELLVTTEKKGIKTEKNVINDILSWEKTEEGIDIVLKFGGNGNLRIDNFLYAVNAEQDSDVIKKELYCTKNAKIILTDEFVLEFRL